MKIIELTESTSKPCIVVDIQPAYTGVQDGNELHFLDDMIAFLNKQTKVLCYFNEDATGETLEQVQEYWMDSGYTNFDNTAFIDKGYGYFRAWMDSGVPDNTIIKCIRSMYQQKVSDSRDLFDGIKSETYIEQMAELGIPEDMLEDALSVNWVNVATLREYNNCYIMGGGRDECLREVQLLMNAFNIKYKVIEEFVY